MYIVEVYNDLNEGSDDFIGPFNSFEEAKEYSLSLRAFLPSHKFTNVIGLTSPTAPTKDYYA